MNKRILGGLAAAAMLTGGLALTSAGVASASENGAENKVDYWCKEGLKYDGLSGQTFTVPDPPLGYTWTKLILNGGQDGAPTDNKRSYEPKTEPSPGIVITRPGAAVSNAILCMTNPPRPQTPPNIVTTTWGPCGTGANVASGEQRTITYGWKWVEGRWIEVVASDLTANVERPLDEAEQEACIPTREPSFTAWLDGTIKCKEAQVEQTRSKTMYSYEYTNGKWVESQTTVGQTQPRKLDEIVPCPIETSPVVVDALPPTVPTLGPTVVVSAFSPAQAPPAQAPPAEFAALPVVPAGGLPATGIDGTGVTALIALLLTSLGGAALFASRRRNVTI